MRVSVDRDVCQGHARCNAVCPEIFELDELGFATTHDREVPDALIEAVQEAERSCPERAINITP